ncbi:MAG TPA: tocopherol cyclase family protein [Solirubrobacteraceae bacterium]|nr:tocopherol cyclase family protein [Solirubrobacteraceae bacterium]
MSVARAFRATGADLPFGDPGAAHGVPFEGYFWRVVQPASGVAIVALSAVCRGPDGPWGLSTLAAHPGGFARTVITRTAAADTRAFGVCAEGVLRGDAAALSVEMGPDARLDLSLHDALIWPRRAFAALGPAHAIPWLPQYWQPVVIAADVRGRVRAGDLSLDLDGAVGYAEKNWGRGFPGRWWWGHAAAFDGDDVSVSFAGGRVPLAGDDVAPTAVVLRLGERVIALAPPLSRTRVALGDGVWRLRTHGRGFAVEIAGDAEGAPPHELLVPVPREQRGELRSRQHLAGSLSLRIRRGRRLLYDGRSPLAGLELGLPLSHPARAAPRA